MDSPIEYKKEKIRQIIEKAKSEDALYPGSIDWGDLYLKIIAVMEGRM